MSLTPYRETLALPGIKSLLVVATLARVPITAAAVVLTLHVVNDLGMGYGAAGLVGAAWTVGASLGAPFMGRFVDRRGLRPMLVVTTVAEVVFWLVAQSVPYWVLLVGAIGGFLSLPAFSVARQSIAALTPEAQRLPAFALDSITTEVSFMAGPALGVLIATTAGPRVAMVAIGGGMLLAGIGLWLLNPPIRSHEEEKEAAAATERVPRRAWMRPELFAVFAVTMAATVVLSGTDVAVVANLRHNGQLAWTGLVMSLWAGYSLLGGFLYGTVKRGLPPVLLLAPMAVLTLFVGLGGGHWWLLALLLIPAGALCAPTITASADAVSRLTPASARGEAMGWHNSSLTVGVALGSPLAGVVMDRWSPPWGFVAVGAFGGLVTLIVIPIELRRRARAAVVGVSEAATDGVEAPAGLPELPQKASSGGARTPRKAAAGAARPPGTRTAAARKPAGTVQGAASEPQKATSAARKPAKATTSAATRKPRKATGAGAGKPAKGATGAAAGKPAKGATGAAAGKPAKGATGAAAGKPAKGATGAAAGKPAKAGPAASADVSVRAAQIAAPPVVGPSAEAPR
jgi:predicted MFS family arabinose efflux permease